MDSDGVLGDSDAGLYAGVQNELGWFQSKYLASISVIGAQELLNAGFVIDLDVQTKLAVAIENADEDIKAQGTSVTSDAVVQLGSPGRECAGIFGD